MYAEGGIRSIRPGEEKVVCRLVARVFNEFVAPDYPPEGIAEFFRYADPKAMAGRIAGGNIVLVAEADERLVGMIEITHLRHIAMLFVERRGEGVGRELVGRALDICSEAIPAVTEVTVHASSFAVPIYRRLGFEKEGPERTENGITYIPMSYRFER